MVEERANLDYGRDSAIDDELPSDASDMSEGIGGTPDLDEDEERETDDEEVNPEASTYGAP